MSESQPPKPAASKLPPNFTAYLALNAAVYVFLALMTALLSAMLGSARGLILFAMFLGGGFTIISVYDYFWLRRANRD